eukprot:GHUV01043485.1.p1 GENE.GHUV01043485.1~~GHUV01043485.1.p1  ORF type:complete len:220 (+),score=34.49 GHUV01043485.1:67-726(+)
MGQFSSKTPLQIPSLTDDSSKEFCTRMAFKLTPSYSSKLQARVKWLQVIETAKQDGWQPNFDPADLTASNIQRLAERIDKAFLHGSFKQVCRPRYLVKEELTGEVQGLSETAACNAVAGFEQDSNTLIVFRKGWQREPSFEKPVQSDGVYCFSRLEWLCHTLGHEMIHCIVHNACPQSRDYLAYAHDNGHGPIFRRLNRHIFGHSATIYKHGWSRLGRH